MKAYRIERSGKITESHLKGNTKINLNNYVC